MTFEEWRKQDEAINGQWDGPERVTACAAWHASADASRERFGKFVATADGSERAAVVAWLRSRAETYKAMGTERRVLADFVESARIVRLLAERIEAGEHREAGEVAE